MSDHEKPVEFDYPVSAYYRNFVLDGETITHTGSWWTAILLIKEPKSGKPFIGLYRWQKVQGQWKLRKRFSVKRRDEVAKAMSVITKFAEKLDE